MLIVPLLPQSTASRRCVLDTHFCLTFSFDQIIPAIPHRMLEITVVWNPVRSALGPHFDPALIDPVENAELVRDAVVVGGVPPTEFEVREEGREIVLTRRSLIHQQLVVVFNRARLAEDAVKVCMTIGRPPRCYFLSREARVG